MSLRVGQKDFWLLFMDVMQTTEPWIDLSGEVARSEEGPGVIWRAVGEEHLERGRWKTREVSPIPCHCLIILRVYPSLGI